MRIKTDKTLTHAKGKHSWTIRPESGTIKHFPKHVCLALIEKGAVEVGAKKSPQGDAEQSA